MVCSALSQPSGREHRDAAHKRVGVAILANDEIYDWLLPFLESYRQHNPFLPMFLIPFDRNIEKTTRAAHQYNVSVVQDGLESIDQFARKIYPFYRARYRHRLRKFYCLNLPLDEVMYLDVDTLVYRDLSGLFGHVEAGLHDFIIASTSPEWVYTSKVDIYPDLARAIRFSDGFFITSRHILRLDKLIEAVTSQIAVFHSIRKSHVYSQPVANFAIHRLGLEISSLNDLIPDASCETFYQAMNVKFMPDGPVDVNGRAIYFAHWAGAKELPQNGTFDGDWKEYAARAANRMR